MGIKERRQRQRQQLREGILGAAREIASAEGWRAAFYYVQRWPGLFQQDLSTVLSLLAEGKVRARVARRMPLEKASEALGLLVSGKVSGKVVLVPDPEMEG